MKRIFPIFAVLILFFFSCQKSDNENPPPEDPPGNTDDIVYSDLDPNLILHPVDSFGLHPSGLCQEIIPYPSDSLESVELDMDGDGVNDFRFTYQTYFHFVSAGLPPCEYYNSSVTVYALNTGYAIATHEPYNQAEFFVQDDTIDSSLTYTSNGYIFYVAYGGWFSLDSLTGEGFIGVILADNKLGWIKLSFDKNTFTFIIMAYGFNNTAGLEIKAGQTE